MKKLLILSMLFFSCITNAQTSPPTCKKTFAEPNGILHCLLISSGTVSHVFDAMPKVWLYKYTGSRFLKNEYSELMKENKLVVHYPTYVNSSQEFQIEVLIPTGDEQYMTVALMDLNAADEYGARKIKELQKESDALADRLGYPKTKIKFEENKPAFLNAHDTLYKVALAVNQNYIESEKRGLRPFEFPNFQKGYVSFDESDHSGYYAATIKGRYMISIKLRGIKTLKDCQSVENYVSDYLTKLDAANLPGS